MNAPRAVWFAAAVVVVAAGTVVRPAFAQVTCPSTVPWPLVTLCADAPARASDVNANFTALATLVAQRTGNPDAGIALPSSSVGTATIAPSAVTSGSIADGTIAEADLSLGLRCPDTSRTQWGQCIFWRGGTTPSAYIYTLRQAANACRTEGARLCLLSELQAAWAAGLELCSLGWLADGASTSTGNAAYPMQVGGPGCGGAGVNLSANQSVNNLYGAWCCK